MDDTILRPYSDTTEPGRKDVNGVEWWACDPYPTWYRWEDGKIRIDHAEWLADDPKMLLRQATLLELEADELYKRYLKLREQADNCRKTRSQIIMGET